MGLPLLLAPLDRPGDPPEPKMLVRRREPSYRWALTYIWAVGEPILPWIMLNPSHAGGRSVFDLTARRVIRFSWHWGFGGALLLNACPIIAPRTQDLRAWLDGFHDGDIEARDALWHNQRILRDELAVHDTAMVAWGCSHLAWPRLEAYSLDLCLEQAFDAINDPEGPRAAVLRTFCLGRTLSGHPLHPMARGRHRVPDHARPIPFPDHPGTIRGLEVASAGQGAVA